ncbi:MAG: efflux RND transporter periplasmic adaptor subunit [Arenicellaceae bacterium]|nr:efflux RND transporter periplasmic adaptor subunit [Arenicellaceae bacterium]
MTKNLRYALIILVLVLVWLFSGLIINSDGTDENLSKSDQAIKLIRVQVSDIVEESFVPRLNISARTEAFRVVEIKAETSGQIEVIPIAEGEFVKAGDELARLRIDDRSFRVQEAQAGLDQATLDYQGTITLFEKELVSEIQVARAKASVDAAKANLEFRNVELSRTRLLAPFDAVLNERKLEVGSYLQPGQTFAELLQLDPIKAVALVSGDEVLDLEKGALVELELSNGDALLGELRYVSAKADTATRAFRIEAFFENPDNKIFADLTGNLMVPRAPTKAHRIPASIISLNSAGNLQVKWVDEGDVVRASEVTILHDDRSSLWVSGLPETVRIIDVGQEYVTVEEKVDPIVGSKDNSG